MDHKQRSIAEKYSLDYYRRSLATRSWKSPWNYAALVLALLVIGGMYLFGGNTVFQAAPVASVHSSFGTNCASCHDQSWAPAKRLTTLSDEHHSVSDDTCAKCHSAGPHAPFTLAEPACAACHQEHRSEKRLTDVADGACIRCHQDLTSTANAAASFSPKIRQFEAGTSGHPEFALLRSSVETIGPRHGVRTVAKYIDAADGRGKWVDRGVLKFNHRVHLDPAGVLNPDRKRTVMSCSSCHQSEHDGGYMKPIQYELHCASCHPLPLSGPFSEPTKLPHSSVEEVRGVIRERLARVIERALRDNPVVESHLPRLPVPAWLSADQEQQLAAQMEIADHAVFGLEAKGMCRHCHHIDQRDGQWHVAVSNPTVADDVTSGDMVPSRWMAHARFNHKSHRAVECAACHTAVESSETADILMPSINVCLACHGEGASTSSNHISADCVLCHTYHMESHADVLKGVPLKQLIPDGRSSPVDNSTP